MTETKVFILVRGWKFATAVRKKVSETRVFGKYWKTCRFRLMHSILFVENSVGGYI